MSLNLASHLKKSRYGIFYFRMAVPHALRQKIGKSEIVQSLRTREPVKAKKLAYTCAYKTFELFDMAYDPTQFNPFDVSTFPTADSVRKYEIDLSKGVFKSTDEADHKRLMEALAVIKSMPAQPVAPTPAPAQWVEPTPAHTITLNKALTAYLATVSNEKTRNAIQREIMRFIELVGNVEVHKIRGVDVVNWNNKLLAGEPTKKLKPQAPRTADNSIQFLQGLLKWAQKNEYIHNTAKIATEGKFNLTKKQRSKATKGADGFNVEQLIKIFNPITYQDFYGDSQARYWLPLIALHTGARLEEIAQLTPADIKTESGSGVLYFDINRNNGKSVKTDTALRNIPIHDKLIELGFIDYVRSRKGCASLFVGSGSGISHAFIRYLEKIGVKQENDKRSMVFHSFRDTFNNILALPALQVQERLRYALMGHSKEDTNANNYTKTITVKENKEWGIDKLVFEEIIAGMTYKLILTKRA